MREKYTANYKNDFLSQTISISFFEFEDVKNFYCELEKFKIFPFHFQIRDFDKTFHIQMVKHFRKNRGVSSFHSQKLHLDFSHQPNMYSQTETHNNNEKKPPYENRLK